MNISCLNNLKINTKNLNPDSEDKIVYDPYFAAVLNKNREINIENVMYRIVKDGVLAYKNNEMNQSKISKFINNELINKKYPIDQPFQIAQDVIFYPQELFYEKDSFKNSKYRSARVLCTSSGPGLFGHNHECFNEYEPNHFRIKGRTWSQSFGIYASIGYKTTHQWRRFGMWFSKDANVVRRKMNIFEVEFENAFGTQIVDFTQLGIPINFGENYNHHETVWTADFQTGVLTIKPPFVKKPAKARKFKRYETEHRIIRNGSIAEVQLNYN